MTCKLGQYQSVLLNVRKVIYEGLSIRKAEKLKFILISVGTQHAVFFLTSKAGTKMKSINNNLYNLLFLLKFWYRNKIKNSNKNPEYVSPEIQNSLAPVCLIDKVEISGLELGNCRNKGSISQNT